MIVYIVVCDDILDGAYSAEHFYQIYKTYVYDGIGRMGVPYWERYTNVYVGEINSGNFNWISAEEVEKRANEYKSNHLREKSESGGDNSVGYNDPA